MRISITIMLSLWWLVSAAGGQTTYWSTVGAIGSGALHYEFEEGSGTSTADASGNGLTGTLVNTPTWTTGKIAAGLNFAAASSEHVTFAGLSFGSSDPFTVAAWVRFTGTTGSIVGDTGSNTSSFRIANTTQIRIRETGGGNTDFVFAVPEMTAGVWYHVAATKSAAGSVRVYVNAAESSTGAQAGFDGTFTPDLVALLSVAGVPQYHDGDLDEVRVYGAVLTATQLDEIRLGPEPTSTGTLAISGALLGGNTLSLTGDTWDAHNNGSITHSYTWETASDGGGTGAATFATTATAALPPSARWVRATKTATNSGGTDPAYDMTTNWVQVPISYHRPELLAKLDATPNDVKGLTGTAGGTTAYEPGQLGQGLTCTGANDVRFGDVHDKEFNASFSWAWWDKQGASPSAFMPIISKRQNSGSFRGYEIARAGNVATDPVRVILRSGTSNSIDIDYPHPNTTTWNHFVWTHSGSGTAAGMKFYVNGTQVTATTVVNDTLAGQTTVHADGLSIASRNGASFFTGAIDDVRLYSLELTAADVAALYLFTYPRAVFDFSFLPTHPADFTHPRFALQ